MNGEQVYGAIGLTVTLGALGTVVVAVIADARAQKAHEDWERRFHDWLWSGMKGPQP